MKTVYYVTGAGGMVGNHLCNFLVKKPNVRVYGSFFKPTTDMSEIDPRVELFETDVRYEEVLYRDLKRIRPDVVFHLAAQSIPVKSLVSPSETLETNILGTVNVFEALRACGLKSRVLVAGSSAAYGETLFTSKRFSISEETPIRPLHAYGISKICQEYLTYSYFKNDAIPAVSLRIFNTTGPQKTDDVCSDFVKRAVMAEKGKGSTRIPVGNLKSKRVIADVRDLVEVLYLLSREKRAFGQNFVFCAERVYQISEVFEQVRRLCKKPLTHYVDPKLLRPFDEPYVKGDNRKLKRYIRWRQRYDLETTLKDMMDYVRRKMV